MGFTASLLLADSSFAAIFSKDLKAVHERFDLLESKIDALVGDLNNLLQTIKVNEETGRRNQADLKEEVLLLNEKLSKMSGLEEANYFNLFESVKGLENRVEGDFRKLKEYNRAFFEQEKKNKELFFKNFQLELKKLTRKIADMVSIYKTLSEEEIDRDNENITNLNKKMEGITLPINQLIQVYKDMAVEQIFREESLSNNFNKQFNTVNQKISQLIDIYKQSISAITASSKTNLGKFEKQLAAVNTKIKKLTEIYKVSIKENSATFRTINKNLSKELQLINNKLSNLNILVPAEKKHQLMLNPLK